MADKDNIGLTGVPTMAACPAYAYLPNHSATVVQRLLTARAIAISKTNLDQFATGLVGVRSPYGLPRNPFDPAYIPGGSSLGSAAAVLSVVERLVAIETFLYESGDAMHSITRQIIDRGRRYSAIDTFRAFYRLESLRLQTQVVWKRIDCLVVPTAPTIYRIDALEAEPMRLSSSLDMYTNVVNLLDLAALAVPSGFRPTEIPTGSTLIAPAITRLC